MTIASGLTLNACAEPTLPPSFPPLPTPPLRELAERHGLRIGPAVGQHLLRNHPVYAAVLAREFNILTAENDMKWAAIHPERERFNWDASDPYVAFAEAHGMLVRGHTLTWHAPYNPAWLEEGGFSRAELIDIYTNHIKTVVGRYRGRVAMWDVVNEALADKPPYELRDTIWSRVIGPDYLDIAFRAAHAADPDAILVYNDYSVEEPGNKADALFNLVSGLLARGAPVHAVGFQMHIMDIDPQKLAANLARFAALGVDLHITEMDVRLPLPVDAAALERQADIYRKVLEVCLNEPACKVFQTWGFTDAFSWIPRHFPGLGAALPLDADFQPKPAWMAMREALSSRAPATPPTKPRLINVRRIWNAAPHNAFTDLIRHQDRWLCVLREASSHMAPDGALRIIASTDGATWTSAALLALPDADLRDGKLSHMPDGRLLLVGAAAYPPSTGVRHRSMVWHSADGVDWDAGATVLGPNDWLWRVTWHAGTAYGLAYPTDDRGAVGLYTSTDGRHFAPHAVPVFHQGYANEHALAFLPDGSAVCLLRRDVVGGDPASATAQLGTSRAPYTDWTWRDLGVRIGGPAMLRLPDGRLVACVRRYGHPTAWEPAWTALCEVDPVTGAWHEILRLPSGGDSSYAGLVWHDARLWISYYSSHEGQTAVYLAQVEMPLQRGAQP